MAKSGVGTRIVDGDLADNRSGHHPTFASRHLDSDRLAIATHNPGKLAEMHELLAPYGIAVISAGELGLVEPDESGMTFGENARIKAEAAAKGAGFPALADDSPRSELRSRHGNNRATIARAGRNDGGTSPRAICFGVVPSLAGWPRRAIRGARRGRASMAAARRSGFRLRRHVPAGRRATNLRRNVERRETRIAAARQRSIAPCPRFHEIGRGLP